MAIIRKSELQRHVEQLEGRYQRLREAVVGISPNRNLFSNLAGAQRQLEAIGETGAASLLGHWNESLLGI